MRNERLQSDTITIHSQRIFVSMAYPLPFLCVRRKFEVGERLQLFEVNSHKWTFLHISVVRRIQNDVHDDAMRDAKLFQISPKFKWS